MSEIRDPFCVHVRRATAAVGRDDLDGAARHLEDAERARRIAAELEAAATPWLDPNEDAAPCE